MTNDVMAAENRLEMAQGRYWSHVSAHACYDATKDCRRRSDLLSSIRARREQLEIAEEDHPQQEVRA